MIGWLFQPPSFVLCWLKWPEVVSGFPAYVFVIVVDVAVVVVVVVVIIMMILLPQLSAAASSFGDEISRLSRLGLGAERIKIPKLAATGRCYPARLLLVLLFLV